MCPETCVTHLYSRVWPLSYLESLIESAIQFENKSLVKTDFLNSILSLFLKELSNKTSEQKTAVRNRYYSQVRALENLSGLVGGCILPCLFTGISRSPWTESQGSLCLAVQKLWWRAFGTVTSPGLRQDTAYAYLYLCVHSSWLQLPWEVCQMTIKSVGSARGSGSLLWSCVS